MINKDKEVGGNHYSDMAVEPIELIQVMHLDFVQGSIVKYISRYKAKGGKEDLNKAMHYCEIGAEYWTKYGPYQGFVPEDQMFAIHLYCKANGMNEIEERAILQAASNHFSDCYKTVKELINQQEGAQ